MAFCRSHPSSRTEISSWHQLRDEDQSHTFHLPYGEVGLTLQDVSIQLDLPVDGHPMTGGATVLADECKCLLGVMPSSRNEQVDDLG